MILLGLALIGGAAAALIRGGSLERLAATRFRWLRFLVAGLGIQVAADVLPADDLGDAATKLIMLSYAAIVVFLVANHDRPGLRLALTGVALNLVVIAANGAMPVWDRAIDIAGERGAVSRSSVKHEAIGDRTKLPWLGDVIPLPRMRQVVSGGDVLLAAGIARFVYARTRVRDTARRREATRTSG